MPQTMAQKIIDHSGIEVTTDLAELPASLPEDHDIAIYRIAQESLNNAVKHSGASHLTVRTSVDNSVVTLSTADDGAGFDPERTPDQGSFGLSNLRERIALLGGKLHIDSAPGRGTTLNFSFPITESR